jgi:nuclear pore complex protein Nup155
MVKTMAHRLNLSENTFPAAILIPMLEQYALEFQNMVGPKNWVIDLFIDVGFAYETILGILQGMWYNDMAPFTGRHKRVLADHMLYICEQWYEDCVRHNTRLFGGDDNALEISGLLDMLTEHGLQPDEQERAADLRRKIQRSLR